MQLSPTPDTLSTAARAGHTPAAVAGAGALAPQTGHGLRAAVPHLAGTVATARASRAGGLHRLALTAALTVSLVAGSKVAHAADITVSAAASLTNAFREIAQRYQEKHPDARVLLNFGASGALLQQMRKGAPVDVFASADQETMDKAVQSGLVSPAERHDFARNALVVIVPADSTLRLAGLHDLRTPAISRIALGNPASVPVGRYARQALEAAGLWAPVSARVIHTQNVRQSLDYVARGEVEAGFVYATDVAVMKDRVKTAFTVPVSTPISYPVASTVRAGEQEATHAEARRFVDYLRSTDGQAVLQKHHFQPAR